MDETGNPPAQPLFDLSGMSPADARDYVISLAAHLKQAEADLGRAVEELALWEGRVAMANQRGLVELKAQAEAKRSEAAGRKTSLEMEVWEFRAGVETVKKQLAILPMTQRSINTSALLDTLAHLGGPLDQVTPVTKRAEAEEALAALKKKMAGG